eukprot:scaffold80752_cov69-Cyclotella_meneghiniana.AAC.14
MESEVWRFWVLRFCGLGFWLRSSDLPGGRRPAATDPRLIAQNTVRRPRPAPQHFPKTFNFPLSLAPHCQQIFQGLS